MSTTASKPELLSNAALSQSVERMRNEEILTLAEQRDIVEHIPADLQDARYILKHLGAHLAIGGFRAATMIPLPIGTIGRPLWVLSWRITETLKGNSARASVHSLPVFLFALLPFLGYSAYLIALRKSNERFAFIMANHLCYARRDMNAADFYQGRSIVGRWLMRVVVPPAWAALGRETPA